MFSVSRLLVVFQVESFAQCGRVTSIERPDRVPFQQIKRFRCGYSHMNSLHFLHLGLDGIEACNLADTSHHIEKEITARRVIADHRIITQQVCRLDLVDMRVTGVGFPKRLTEALDVLFRRSDQQIDILGGAYQSMESHSRGAYQDILQSLRLECPESA